MPLETLQQPLRQPASNGGAAVPPRLRPKGPVGPDFYRQFKAAASRPKQSAVERLEADKAKYVKSQVALSKLQPVVRPPEARSPPLNPGTAMRPTRKTPNQTKTRPEEVQLNLEHLSNLINGAGISEQSCGCRSRHGTRLPLPHTCRGPTEKGKAASGPSSGLVQSSDGEIKSRRTRQGGEPSRFWASGRKDGTKSGRHASATSSDLRPFHTRTTSRPSPALKPVVAPSKPDDSPTSLAETPALAPSPPSFPSFPPSSPAITRLSSSSSRKRPSLTRSKSDLSDRCSRAGTDLERFFNLCGLDPAELQLTGSNSDIVSMARFRSVSAPGSECAGTGEEDGEEEEDASNAAERVPYGVSVIERNARVIKWLYGLRQAKEGKKVSHG
uniref:Family with sequence similarity 110 member A n=1 Tax=Gasterosteus aculeatus TaxID=69293 RepID=G3PEF3_GASAC